MVLTDHQFTTPHFRSLLPPLRATGLFIQHPSVDYFKFYSVPLDYPNTPFPIRSHTFAHDPSHDPEKIEILNSCNGLLLCSTFIDSPSRRIDYYVYNPSTSQLATLPKYPRRTWHGICYVGLAFDPSKSLHYKVIFFVMSPLHYDFGDFHIYSSDTKTWKASVKFLKFQAPDRNFISGVYWNGCMHWLSPDFNSHCLYFNVDKERSGTFPGPPRSKWPPRCYFGESEGHLHYAQVYPLDSSFRVYEMKNDYSEWFVKYHIDLVPISKAFPKMKIYSIHTGVNFCAAVAAVMRRENSEESFLVLALPGKIIRYNLVDGSFKVIWDFVVPSWSYGNYKAWPYFE